MILYVMYEKNDSKAKHCFFNSEKSSLMWPRPNCDELFVWRHQPAPNAVWKTHEKVAISVV